MVITKKKIIYLTLFFSLGINFLISYFKFPGFFRYGIDFLLIISCALSFSKKDLKGKKNKYAMSAIFVICLYVLYTILSMLINGVNLILYIFQARMFFRGFLVMYIIIKNFDLKDVKFIQTTLIYLLIPNILLIILQYYLGLDVDKIGGIFGTNFGYSNTCQSTYLMICLSILVSKYLYRRIKTVKVFFFLALTLLASIFAEIKIFYVQVAIIIIFYLVFEKNMKKSATLLICLCIIAPVFIKIFYKFNEYTVDFFTIEGIKEYVLSGYAGQTNGVSRINGFSFVNNNLFDRNLILMLSGKGFGSAGTSNILGFYSVIFKEYGWSHYDYFIYSYVYLETGFIGLILYIMPFIIILLTTLKCKNEYMLFTFFVLIFTFISFFYDQMLITDVCTILLYFIYSIPFIILKKGYKMYKL